VESKTKISDLKFSCIDK